MKLIFVTGASHLPQSMGGVQSSTDSIITTLAGMGHTGAVACALWGEGKMALSGRFQMKLTRQPFARDRTNGYCSYRAWDILTALPAIVRAYQPDVAIVQHVNTMPLAQALIAAKVPSVLYFRNAEFPDLKGDLRDLPDHVRYIANSRFTASAYAQKYGVSSAVIPPLIRAENYRTSAAGKAVVMINPHPIKGVEVALAVAELCPDIPFRFVQSWGLLPEHQARMTAALEQLPNITVLPATRDMKAIYAQARLVLAPSQYEEAWGRIASEAHVSGIPVVGSDRGGLPEAIGPGGVALPANAPASEWAATVRRIWSDDAFHAALSHQALHYAEREEMQPEGQARLLLDTAQQAIDAFHAAGVPA